MELLPSQRGNARGFVGLIVLLCAAAIPVAWMEYSASNESLIQTRAERADLPAVQALQARLQAQLDALCKAAPSAALAGFSRLAVNGLEQSIKDVGSDHLILDPETPAYYLAYLCTVKWPERARLAAWLLTLPGGRLPSDAQERWAQGLDEERRALDLALAGVPQELAQSLRLQQEERQQLAVARPFDRPALCQAAQADRRLWLMSLQLMDAQLQERAQREARSRDRRLGFTVSLLLVLLGAAALMLRRLLQGGEAVAAEARGQAEQDQWSFYDSVPFGVLLVEVPGLKVLRANQALARMLGEPGPVAPGTDLRMYFDIDERRRLEQLDALSASPEAESPFRRWNVRLRDGSVRVLESAARIMALQGRTVSISLIRDVTAQAAMEERLLASERRFRLLYELSEEAVLISSADRIVIYASPSLQKVLGYPPEERVGLKSFALTHPEDLAVAEAHSLNVRSNEGVQYKVRVRMRHKDGGWRQMELSSVSHLGDPDLACVVTTLRDFTDRNRLERAVEAGEAHFRAVVENADDLLLCYQPGTGLRAENPEALRALGLPPDHAFSAASLQLIHPEDLPGVMHAVERALKEPGKALSLQARLKAGDGRWRDFEGRARGLGQQGVLLTLRDVTDGKAVQKQLVRYERLAAIGQTASGLAHEVRNPLAVVSATAEYLRGQLADRPALQNDLGAVLEAVERIRDLVGDVLERSRDRELKRASVPADQLMEQACKSAQLRFGPAGERVRVLRDFGAQAPRLDVDLRQMDRVVTNLVLNALQAMHGEGSLTLSARVDGQMARLEVADDGPGVPEAELAKIFEPFYTTKEQGSGLGLWICKSIVEEHGGRLEALLRQPRGCAFVIHLPLPAAEERPS